MRSSLPVIAALLALTPQLSGCKSCADSPDPVTLEEEEFTGDWGQWMSAEALPSGQIAVLSYDRTSGGADYAVGTPGETSVTWDHEPVDGYFDANGLDSGDRGQYASLAIAEDGTAWAAYYDAGNKTLRYAVRATTGTQGTQPHGSYGTTIEPPVGTVLAWRSDQADVGTGPGPDGGRFASIALDSDDNPVIAHYDKSGGALRVAHWVDGAFQAAEVDGGEDYVPIDTGEEARSADVGAFAELLIVDGTEYIAYYDAALGDLKLAVGTAGSYSIEVVDADGDVGQWPEFAIASDGTMMIAYHDVENQDLKLATGGPGNWTTEVLDSGEWVGADAAFAGPDQILYFDGHHNNLKRATKSGDGWATGVIAGESGEASAVGFHNEAVNVDGRTFGLSYDHTAHEVWISVLD